MATKGLLKEWLTLREWRGREGALPWLQQGGDPGAPSGCVRVTSEGGKQTSQAL